MAIKNVYFITITIKEKKYTDISFKYAQSIKEERMCLKWRIRKIVNVQNVAAAHVMEKMKKANFIIVGIQFLRHMIQQNHLTNMKKQLEIISGVLLINKQIHKKLNIIFITTDINHIFF